MIFYFGLELLRTTRVLYTVVNKVFQIIFGHTVLSLCWNSISSPWDQRSDGRLEITWQNIWPPTHGHMSNIANTQFKASATVLILLNMTADMTQMRHITLLQSSCTTNISSTTKFDASRDRTAAEILMSNCNNTSTLHSRSGIWRQRNSLNCNKYLFLLKTYQLYRVSVRISSGSGVTVRRSVGDDM